MTDQIDHANDQAELILSCEIAAALDRARADIHAGTYCRVCDEPLPAHRRVYGVCVPCRTREERIAMMRGRGK